MTRTLIRGCGELCLTLGVILLLFVAYLIWGTAWQASNAQHAFASQLEARHVRMDLAAAARQRAG